MSCVFNFAHDDGYALISGLYVSLVARMSVTSITEKRMDDLWRNFQNM